MKKNRRRSLRAAEPESAAPVSVSPAGARERPPHAKSRRRSLRLGAIDEQRGEANEPQPDEAHGRPGEANEHRAGEANEHRPGRAGESRPGRTGESRLGKTGGPRLGRTGEPDAAGDDADVPAGASRRRSRRSGTADAPAEDATRSPAPSAVGALSGQLPPGTVREAGMIATEAGRYLRQAARDEAPSRYGSPAGEIDESARRVWEIAFGLAVRRRFEPDTALAEISRTVATAVHDHAAAAMPMLDAEMLVRTALGETVPVGDIDGGVLTAVHLLLFASLADELALGDAELDQLIAEAEENAAALVGV